jgi:hypothetical protein
MRTAERPPVAEASFAAPCPFRGFSPFDVFPAIRSLLPGIPIPPDSRTPSGFLTLSTSCSPDDLSGLFHPESVPGILPSRFLSFRVAVRPLERRPLLWLPPLPKQRLPHFRVLIATEVPPRPLGFSQVPCGYLLEIFLLRGSSPTLATPAPKRLRHPLSRFDDPIAS